MSRSQKPRKAYRPRDASPRGALRLQPWKLNALFGPLEHLLASLERGDPFYVTDDGALSYFVKGQGAAYEIVEAIFGVVETYDIARLRDRACPDTGALQQLAEKLRASAPLTTADLDRCHACLARLRAYTAQLSQVTMTDLVNTAAIKFALDDLPG
ncbi:MULTISPECIES: hypothetical protein [unclassified Cupriavidus]|uniref:hypothetical protein n=1 Tax=Cupriavidus sp. H19C3 TaxID=3241603 RepID=UPI003BF85439